MASAYASLGTDIMVNAIVYASDVSEVQTFIIRELQRRGLGYVGADNPARDQPANRAVIEHIYTNCRTAGYGGSAPTSSIPTAAEIKSYIDYAKQLYLKILRP